MLQVNSIDVFYGSFQALRGVSLNVDEGKITALLGPNGAGKTTTLKTIIGLLHPKNGSIAFKGERIDRSPPHSVTAKGIAVVPEGRQLFPYMTVVENLQMGAFGRAARKTFAEELGKVLNLFPVLEERRNQLAGTLSGGEGQMLAIGRALVSKPKLLILDEPSLGLAPIIVEKIFETILELNSRGLTILIVEQNAVQTLSVSHNAFVLESGSVVKSGEGKALLVDERVREAYLGI